MAASGKVVLEIWSEELLHDLIDGVITAENAAMLSTILKQQPDMKRRLAIYLQHNGQLKHWFQDNPRAAEFSEVELWISHQQPEEDGFNGYSL